MPQIFMRLLCLAGAVGIGLYIFRWTKTIKKLEDKCKQESKTFVIGPEVGFGFLFLGFFVLVLLIAAVAPWK